MQINQSILVEAMCMLGENYQSILEAYVGRPKELIKCEGYLNEIVNELKKESLAKANGQGLSYKKQVTKDYIWNKKLETELANFFKVGKVNIYWQSSSGPNGFTVKPFGFTVLNNRNKYLSGGMSNATIDICIMEECVTVSDLTAQELMATILHEIGHNFYMCPILFGTEVFRMIITLPTGIISTLLAKLSLKIKWFADDVLKKYAPMLYNIKQGVQDILFQVYQFIAPLNIGTNILNSLLAEPNLMRLPKYGDESGADSFAAKYGYGPELSSALQKFQDPKNTLYGKLESDDTIGIWGALHDLSRLSLELVACLTLDPHPNDSQRAANIIKKLKSDLATGDYPDGMKKDLENEIKRMEEIYKVCAKNNSPSSLQIRQGWYDIINGIFDNNSDFRQLFSFYFDSFRF